MIDLPPEFRAHFDTLEAVIQATCRRQGVFGDEADEFGAWLKFRLVESDYAMFRKYKGRSSLRTYLSVVVRNLFRDFRISKWGKWRPSAKAKRLGPSAVLLERRLYRDRLSLHEAVEQLVLNEAVELNRAELYQVASQLPTRLPRTFEGEDGLRFRVSRERADSGVADQEAAEEAIAIRKALVEALGAASSEDRLILQLRFREGVSVAQIARTLCLDQRRLYVRLGRLFSELRRRLAKRSVTFDRVQALLGWAGLELEVDFVTLDKKVVERVRPRRSEGQTE